MIPSSSLGAAWVPGLRFGRRIRQVFAHRLRTCQSCPRSQPAERRVGHAGGAAPKLEHERDSVAGPDLRCGFCLGGLDGLRTPPVAAPPAGIIAGGHGRSARRCRSRPRRQPSPQALAQGPPGSGRRPGGTAQGHQEGSRVKASSQSWNVWRPTAAPAAGTSAPLRMALPMAPGTCTVAIRFRWPVFCR